MFDDLVLVPKTSLARIAAAVLAVALGGCCTDVPDETEDVEYQGDLADDALLRIRQVMPEDARCEEACRELAEAELGAIDEVMTCDAIGDVDATDPWHESNTKVSVTCSGTYTSPGFCTGRRPQGHHEVAERVQSIGSWLAIHAHLEAASITAFEELAAWLGSRGAPASLIERTLAAAGDERAHAQSMRALAERHGASVPPCIADTPAPDLLSVALHNAVEGCVHESFAAIVAAHQARICEADDYKSAFEVIARDELRHGQLAWDLHGWLMERLSAAERAEVVRAQNAALRRLPEVARANAAETPAGLGWPSPAMAAHMAHQFAAAIALG